MLYPQQIREGGLRAQFDVLILPSGALPLPESLAIEGKAGRTPPPPDASRIPTEFHPMLGELGDPADIAALREFIESGGHVIATGSSTGIALALDVPLMSHLRVRNADGSERALNAREYYIPGSVLQVAVNQGEPVTWGLPARLDLYFSDGRWDNAPVFAIPTGSPLKPLLHFDQAVPLRSGWALGQEYLQGGVLAAQARLGKGYLTLFGTDITFRSQTHGAFKLLFNSLLQGAADETRRD